MSRANFNARFTGHRRRDIENLACNYLVNPLPFDHRRHRHPTAITAFALPAFSASILLPAFHPLNGKPQRHCSVKPKWAESPRPAEGI